MAEALAFVLVLVDARATKRRAQEWSKPLGFEGRGEARFEVGGEAERSIEPSSTEERIWAVEASQRVSRLEQRRRDQEHDARERRRVGEFDAVNQERIERLRAKIGQQVFGDHRRRLVLVALVGFALVAEAWVRVCAL